jgi:hypothetical protein
LTIDKTPQIQDIDAFLLAGFVRQVLDCPEAEIMRWECIPVRYLDTETLNRGLYRLRGSAPVITDPQKRTQPVGRPTYFILEMAEEANSLRQR